MPSVMSISAAVQEGGWMGWDGRMDRMHGWDGMRWVDGWIIHGSTHLDETNTVVSKIS